MYEYEAKTLPNELLSSYFNNECTNEDIYIIKQLLKYDHNKDKYLHFKEVYKNEFAGADLLTSNIMYFPYSKKEFAKMPQAGEVWRLKRVMPVINCNIIEPVAQERFIFILSEPLPLENSDGVVSENLDYYNFLALPISFELNFATHHDYIIPSNNDVLGIGFMISTDYAFNVSNNQLDRYIGRIKNEDIDCILNMHFYEYGADYKEQIYQNALKGIFFDDDFGPKYNYRFIIEDNFNDITEYNTTLFEMFETTQINENTYTYISNPINRVAADDGTGTNLKEEKITLLKNKSHDIYLNITETGECILFITHNKSIINGNALLTIKSLDNTILIEKDLDLTKLKVNTKLEIKNLKDKFILSIDYNTANVLTKVIDFNLSEIIDEE